MRERVLGLPSPLAALSLTKVGHLLGLRHRKMEEVAPLFERAARARQSVIRSSAGGDHVAAAPVLWWPDFLQCFEALLGRHHTSLPATRRLLVRLFRLLDANENGEVDMHEALAGLSVLCEGGESNVTSLFRLQDSDGDGYVSRPELERYLRGVFRIAYASMPGMYPEVQRYGVRKLATVAAQQCFAMADLNADGRLSQQEFVSWYQNQPHFVLPPRAVHNAAPTTTHPGVARNDFIRWINLGVHHVEDVVDVFSHGIDCPHGRISYQAFASCCAQFMQTAPAGSDAEAAHVALQAELFSVFGGSSDDSVSAASVCAALLPFCGGGSATKLRTAAMLFDPAGDGLLTRGALEAWLQAHFKIMYFVHPGMRQQLGLTEHEAAATVVDEAFAAPKSAAGSLSTEEARDVDEVLAWFRNAHPVPMAVPVLVPSIPDARTVNHSDEVSPASHPDSDSDVDMGVAAAESGDDIPTAPVVEASASPKAGGGVAAAAPVVPMSPHTSGSTARALINLAGQSYADVFDVFTTGASHGHLTLDQFRACVNQFTVTDTDAAREVVERLFQALDITHNGSVAVATALGGLSVLCGGSHEDKMRRVLPLFAHEKGGKQVLPRERMTLYVCVAVVVAVCVCVCVCGAATNCAVYPAASLLPCSVSCSSWSRPARLPCASRPWPWQLPALANASAWLATPTAQPCRWMPSSRGTSRLHWLPRRSRCRRCWSCVA